MCSIVPVQEASVVIAVSSVHRKDAMDAVHYCIDALKASVPIWKKVICSALAPASATAYGFSVLLSGGYLSQGCRHHWIHCAYWLLCVGLLSGGGAAQ